MPTLRRIGAVVLLVVATLAWTGAAVGIWAQRQALDTDNWVSTSDALLRDQTIRDALGGYLVAQLFAQAPVERELADALPGRLKRLAGPATAGLRQVAEREAPKLLGTAAALSAWRTSNRAAHRVLLRLLDGKLAPNGTVTLDLGSLARQIATATGLPAGLADKLPPQVAELTVLRSKNLATAQDAVEALRKLPIVLTIVAVLAFAGAVALFHDRRRAVSSCGLCLIVSGIALLALRRIGGHVVVDQLASAPNAHAAAPHAWAIATSLLVDVAEGSLLLGAIIVLEAWLASPGRRATALRRALAPAFRARPVLVHGTLAVLLLLLIWWGPVPWTRNGWALLVVAVAAFAWLEWLRRRTVAEFPDAPGGQWDQRWRDGWRLRRLERLGRLRESGAIDQAEFDRRKAALPAG